MIDIYGFDGGIKDAAHHRRLSSGYFHLPTLITVLKRYFEIMANEPSKLDEYVKQQQERTKEVYEVRSLVAFHESMPQIKESPSTLSD